MKKFFTRLFSRPVTPPANLAVLYTDMHSHLIPGIDDGAKTLNESLELIRGLHAAGFQKLITTPHVVGDHFRNTPEIILSGLKILQDAVKKENIPVHIEAAAEYYMDHEFEQKIENRELLAFGGNLVLTEISFLNAPENFDRVLSLLFKNGYRTVLAHAERYPNWFTLERYKKLKEKGVLFQININSLGGYYSGVSKKIAEILIENGMADMLGTDCHKQEHITALQASRRSGYLQKLIQSGTLMNPNL